MWEIRAEADNGEGWRWRACYGASRQGKERVRERCTEGRAMMKRGGGGSAAKGVYKRGKIEAKAERCTGASKTVRAEVRAGRREGGGEVMPSRTTLVQTVTGVSVRVRTEKTPPCACQQERKKSIILKLKQESILFER